MKKILTLFVAVFMLLSITEMNAQKRMTKPIYLGAETGLSVPMGDFGDVANMGFLFQGFVNFFVAPNISLNGSLGYYTWGFDTDVYDGSFYNIPLMFGAHYEIPLEGFTPYFGAELGLNFVGSSDVEINGFKVSSGDSETRFGFAPFFGAFFPVAPNIDLKGRMKFNIIEDANNFAIIFGARFKVN